MSETVQIAVIVSIAPTLAAIGAIIVTLKTKKVAVEKLNHITELTNSTLTAVKKELELARTEITDLNAVISSHRTVIAKLMEEKGLL